MDVECKGSELEPRCSSMFILIQRLVSLLKKRSPCLLVFYVMCFCRASILRDAHSHERHWIFAFLIFRLRLLRLALVADIHSCSKSTSFWWYTCPATDVILVHIFVRIVHWLSTQYFYFLINMHLECREVLDGVQAGLQFRPRFKLNLTGHWFDYEVPGAEYQSRSWPGLLWFEVKNSWKWQGF